MISNYSFRLLFVSVLIMNLNSLVFSQKSIIGLNITSEYTSNNYIRNGFGLVYEREITLHSGFATGLYLRTTKNDFELTSNSNNYSYQIIEVYISIPFLYKFRSNIIDFSFGPSIDYFIGWTKGDSDPNINVTSYSINPKLYYGLLGTVSKTIQFGDKFLIEPEVRFSEIFKYNRYYLGIGISAKYRL